MGLIALAVSDLCYCVSAAPKAFLKTRATTFRSGDFRMFYHMYESYVLNSFSKISTWLVVLMAVSRYVTIGILESQYFGIGLLNQKFQKSHRVQGETGCFVANPSILLFVMTTGLRKKSSIKGRLSASARLSASVHRLQRHSFDWL